jgi:DsbC/DsbD-like thiol-disulfide interchange protein
MCGGTCSLHVHLRSSSSAVITAAGEGPEETEEFCIAPLVKNKQTPRRACKKTFRQIDLAWDLKVKDVEDWSLDQKVLINDQATMKRSQEMK